MRTLFLINPPERKGYSNERSLSGGLGVSRRLKMTEKRAVWLPAPDILLTAAVAENAGAKVAIVDVLMEGFQEQAALDYTLRRVREASGTGDEIFVGIRLSMPTLPADLTFADQVKEKLPQANVFLFGAVIMTTLDHWSRETNADFVLYGEPEAMIGAIMTAEGETWRTQTGVLDPRKYVPLTGDALYDGSAQKRFNRWVQIASITDLPFPAYHLLDMPRYAESGRTEDLSVYVTASRGCPIGCTMCPYMLHEGRPLRASQADRVVDELAWLNKTYGITRIRFRDPNFGFDRKQAREILEKVIARGVKMEATVEGSLECMDESLVELMAKAGVTVITTGIETADEACLASIGQKIKINDILARKIAHADKLGIHVYGTFVIGAPEESWDTVRRTIAYAKEVPCESAFTVMTPFPGTPMYYRALAEGLLNKEMTYAKWNSFEATVRSRFLTSDDLALARLWARLELIIPYRLYWAKKSGGAALLKASVKLIPHQLALRYVRAKVASRRRRGSPEIRVPDAIAHRAIEKIPLTARNE